MNALNMVLLVAFPYVAVIVFVVGVVYRYRRKGFTISSLSSQFLEGRQLFWGSVPFHIGILAVLLVHFVSIVLPGAVLAWARNPVRLIALEVTEYAFGMSVLIGLVALLYRRLTNPRIRAVTTVMDIAVGVLLLTQVALGLWLALDFRWGYTWFAAVLVPYLWSLVQLSPETGAVFALPLTIKLHVVGAFAIVFLVPFTRLVHFVVAPLNYLVRPYQQVIWNWDRRAIRDPAVPWTRTRPTNN
jgi:nitrate reductase gamma subunit